MDKYLLLLLDRLCEPVFVPKGEQKVQFKMPTSYLLEEYQPIAQEILSRFEKEANVRISVTQIAIPKLDLPLMVGRLESFSMVTPKHFRAAAHLTELFVGMQDVTDLISMAAYCRDRVNPQMFVYSLSVIILHRPDSKHLPIPHIFEIFPDKYFDSAIISCARRTCNIVPVGSRVCDAMNIYERQFSRNTKLC